MKRSSPIVFLAFTTLLLSSCALVNVAEQQVNNYLKIVELPTTTKYVVGDAFNHLGLVVADKDDNEVKDYELSIADGTILEEVGTFEVTVSKVKYESTSFSIKVREDDSSSANELNEAKIAAKQELNDYYDAIDKDEYDAEGREALLNIKNQGLDNIDRSVSTAGVATALNNAKVALDAVEKKEINPDRVLTGIRCTPPYNLRYNTGDELNLSGLKVYAIYNDGEDEIVEYEVGNVDMSTPGTKEVGILYHGFNTSFEIEVIEKINSGTTTLEIYTTNDIHGQVVEESNRSGVAKTFTYLKNHDGDNTLLLDQGDTWQGSIYSNANRGAMINEMMTYLGYDARTVGNHDFDWGQQPIKNNKEMEYGDYQMPVLCANVYNYNFETKTVGSSFQSLLADKTVSYTMENGLKVGVVGVIGEGQITSIMSKYVENICFTDHITAIKNESNRLREEGCDVVIASVHAGQEDVINCGLSSYVDLVLCGHTHKLESTQEDDLYYGQFGCYTSAVGHITLTYDYEQGKVTNTSMESISANTISSEITDVDTTIGSIQDKYYELIDEDPNEIVASSVQGYFSKSGELANAMCAAIYHQCEVENVSVDMTYVNDARYNLNKTVWTYADIYQAFPFDNQIYIIEVSYSELMNEISNWNYLYRSPNFDGKINGSEKYRVACIDYLAYHTNSNRYYDYFPDNNGAYITKLSLTYRQIFRNWLASEGYKDGVQLNSNCFSSSLTTFSKTFNTDTSRVKFMMNDGTDKVYKSFYVNSGEAITNYIPAKDPEREGYEFGGWYLEPSCNNLAYYSSVTDNEFVVYAGWAESALLNNGLVAENPFTVTQAVNHIDEFGNDGNIYFVRGRITGTVTPSNYDNGTYKFDITDGRSTMTAYYVQTNGLVPETGDEVIISGQLVLFNNSIYETASGTGTLVSIL